MAKPSDGGDPDFIGRAADLAELAGVISAVCAGTARTFIISGDAGVGKTALVARACSAADPEVAILKGAALPLGSMEVPLLALRSAFRAAGAARLPAPPAFPRESGPDLPLLVDEWLSRLSIERPVLLVVEDLQWADPATLDILMYLVAGPQDRRLGVIGTVRHDEVRAGHTLERWLGDIRRLPGVASRSLPPRSTGRTRRYSLPGSWVLRRTGPWSTMCSPAQPATPISISCWWPASVPETGTSRPDSRPT